MDNLKSIIKELEFELFESWKELIGELNELLKEEELSLRYGSDEDLDNYGLIDVIEVDKRVMTLLLDYDVNYYWISGYD